jgi:hypothetical protein
MGISFAMLVYVHTLLIQPRRFQTWHVSALLLLVIADAGNPNDTDNDELCEI